MNRCKQCVGVGLLLALPQFFGCQSHPGAHQDKEKPSLVEKIDGSELSRVTLVDSAMKRLDVHTGKVSEGPTTRKETAQKAVPYGAVLYDPHGKTWVYTNPQLRTFVRQQIEVDYIEGDVAYLLEGPPTGTEIATVGVAELYGTETKVGY